MFYLKNKTFSDVKNETKKYRAEEEKKKRKKKKT